MLNQVVLVGRLTAEPKLEKTSNGKDYTLITVAVQRNFKNSSGVYETDFIRCVLWNGLAANTSKFCHTGDIVGIKGRLQTRQYVDNEDNNRYVTEVIAERISFLTNKNQKDGDEKTEIMEI